MGHPDRRVLRERKRRAKQKDGLGRRNEWNVLDLTPHNASKKMHNRRFEIKLK